MKKFLLSLLTVMFASSLFAAEETISFTSGYTNAELLTTVTQGDVTLTFDKATGGTAPAWYNTGTAARLYGGNTLTIEANGNSITEIVITFSSSSNTILNSNTISGYSESGATGTWSGSETSVVLTRGGTSGHARIQKVKVTYTASASSVTAPTISPNGGSDLTEAQTVTISGDAGDTFYYTLDGSTPSNESTEYTAPFTVSETTTVKAIAYNSAGDASTVSSAIFSFRVSASSIADLYTKTGKDDSTEIYVNFPLTVTAAGANTVANTYVMDGQGGYSMIYKQGNTSYNVGDVIPGGWYATVQTYGGLDEIKPTANTPEASSTGASVDYSEITAADVIAENQSLPATLRLTFDAATPSKKSAFTGVSGETTITLYNTWLLSSVSAGEYDVRGVVSVNNNNPQFLPLEFVEVIPEPVPDVYILGNVNGNSWSPSQGVQMTYNADGEMYTATITVASGGGSFSFATALGEGDDWDTLNGRDVRWGHGGSDYTLSAEDMQGQNAIACSKYDWTTGSYVVPEGEYNLTLSFDGDGLNAYLFVEKVETAKDVYILGTVNGGAFAPNSGIQMEYDEELGVYVAEVYATSGAMINFAHNLAESWEALNVAGNRFGPDDTANYNVNDTDLEIPAEYSTDPHSFVLAAGKWEVVVNLDNEGYKTVDFTKLTFAAPTFSEESKEFHAAFDLTITGPEGSTITYVLNDDIDNAVTTQSNVAVVSIPAEDTSVLAWATMYGVDSESAVENYLYSASTGTTYTKLAFGDVVKAGKYLIVYEVEVPAASGPSLLDATTTSVLAFDGSRTNASDNKLDDTNNYVELSAENGTITTGDEIYFTISRDNDGFLIKSASGYYIGQASNANGLTASESPIYNAGLSVGDDGAEIISAGGAYLRFNSASNQNRFRYFKSATYSNQKAIQLYYSDTTGVDSVAADSEVVSTAYYNLQGVRLAAPAQGQVAIRVSTLANGQIRASKVVVR